MKTTVKLNYSTQDKWIKEAWEVEQTENGIKLIGVEIYIQERGTTDWILEQNWYRPKWYEFWRKNEEAPQIPSTVVIEASNIFQERMRHA